MMPRTPSGKPPGRPRRGVEVVTRPVTVRLEPAVDLRARCAAEVDGMKFAAWCAAVIAEAVKGRSIIDALRVELANERGEGEGPSEGWEWVSYPGRWDNPNGWSLIERGLSVAAVGRNADGTGWDWHAMVSGALRGVVSGTAPTARDAMRAADLARAGGAT